MDYDAVAIYCGIRKSRLSAATINAGHTLAGIAASSIFDYYIRPSCRMTDYIAGSSCCAARRSRRIPSSPILRLPIRPEFPNRSKLRTLPGSP